MTSPSIPHATVPPRWLEQWQRVQRRYDSFQQLDTGLEHKVESDHYKDSVLAFFQDCYHLKDWLKNDPTTSSHTTDVEKVVHASVNLRLCGDLANGAKHLTLTHPKVGAGAAFGPTHHNVILTAVVGNADAPPKEPILSAKYTVGAGAATYDAFEVATQCVDEWRAYLKGKSLTP